MSVTLNLFQGPSFGIAQKLISSRHRASPMIVPEGKEWQLKIDPGTKSPKVKQVQGDEDGLYGRSLDCFRFT